MVVRGSGFVDHGGVFCRFGTASTPSSVVPALLRSEAELVCVSANVSAGGVVRVALTLNGDRAAFIESNASFEYYDSKSLSVSGVLPVAGPAAGGSLLSVSGAGFALLGPVRCNFGWPTQTVNATVVNSSLVLCATPFISGPEWLGGQLMPGGQREPLEVSLNGQDYSSSHVMFLGYNQSEVHVDELIPAGGPLLGGTEVLVVGRGFADYEAHCRFGNTTELVRARLINASALTCVTVAQASAASVSVEVTLNGDTASHTLTSDGVQFSFYDASSLVTIDSLWPLGGPTGGGTRVVVRGSGFVDHGGVFCQFGASAAATVPATLDSADRLLCTAPPRSDMVRPLDTPQVYRLVHAAAACCLDRTDAAEWLAEVAAGNASAPADCEASCSALDRCRFFSHSAAEARCDLCADCALSFSVAAEVQHSSWQRLGPERSAVRVRLILNGQRDERTPSLPRAPNFTYYLPQALGVSTAYPEGGPVRGGTLVTLTGRGFGALGATPSCRFGGLAAIVNASVSDDGSSLLCRSPPQPDETASMLSVRSDNAGAGLPPEPRGEVSISHRWTVDGCAAVGSLHARHCTAVEFGRAAVSCCALDGSACHAMCVSPVTGEVYPQAEPGGLTGSHGTLEEAELVCTGLSMRLCTLEELEGGLCCGRGCALDDARAWAADPCTLHSELTPIETLPLRAERLRVSVNGQQYSAGATLFGAAQRPQNGSAFSPTLGAPGFTYYDADALRFSALLPRAGPLAGGTLVTILGLGFVDLGARCAFVATGGAGGGGPGSNSSSAAAGAAASTTSFVPARDTLGMMRGRVLTCVTPPSPSGAIGTVEVKVSLNGDPVALTPSALRFTYENGTMG